jgi:hypothetical protein
MMPEPIDLDATQALADVASFGPWVVRKTVDGEILIDHGDGYTVGGTNTSEDAEFIAAARTLLPALVAELRAERVRSQQYREYADRLRATLSAFDLSLDEYVTALTVLHHGVLNGPSYGGFNTLHESTRGHGVEAIRAVLAKLDLDGYLKLPPTA